MDYNQDASYRVVKRVQCAQCKARGGDSRGDNLVIYEDGHEHCYGCGYHVLAKRNLDAIRKLAEGRDMTLQEVADKELNFPRDYVLLTQAIFAKEAFQWLKNYGITNQEMDEHNIGWSMSKNMLIFPVYNTSGKLVMWQGRPFTGGDRKYVGYGAKHDYPYIIGNKGSGTLVVTEDLLSAIKVGRTFRAMPLWGSAMPLGLIQKVSETFNDLGVWLDHDKTRESVLIALRASQYLPTFVVSSAVDPKHIRTETIVEMVWNAQKESIYKEEGGYVPPKEEEEGTTSLQKLKRNLQIVDNNSHPRIIDMYGKPINYHDPHLC